MLAKRIIPCLDVKDGRVVKGVNFVQLRDAGDPVEHARTYDTAGADELVFLDITASSDYRDILLDVVRAVADQVFIPFAVGGGVRTVEDFRSILLAGADKVAANTAAVENPTLITEAAQKFGSQCVVVAIDAKSKASSPKSKVRNRKSKIENRKSCAIRATWRPSPLSWSGPAVPCPDASTLTLKGWSGDWPSWS